MKPFIRSISSKVAKASSTSSLSSLGLDHSHSHFDHFDHFPSMTSPFSRTSHLNHNHHHHHHQWRRRNCLWPYWSTVDRPNRGASSVGHQSASRESSYNPGSPARCTNKQGFVTIPGVENIDPFLLALRFYGFDLWMNRYTETGKRYGKRNFITKVLFYFAILMINTQMVVHVLTSSQVFWSGKKNFYSSLDDIRTFILKFTMTFAVDLWFIRSRGQSGMTHLVVINYLRANSAKVLRRIAYQWMFVMVFCTLTHWAISQYWLSSMTVDDHRKWLNVIQFSVNLDWFKNNDDEFFTIAILRSIATIDSFVYRMYIYGSRFGSMCAYCLLSKLLTECIIQVNRILTDHLDNEYHFHHHYCRKSNHKCSDAEGGHGHGQYKTCSVKFNLELFKEQFNTVYRMHQEIEQCFGPLNFIWFGSLFVVSCIDIFFLAWKAGTEWFKVWSLLEFTSMIVLWVPHFFVAYYASRVSIESRRMKLHLKELCREDEEVRDILVSSMFYPRMKPTLHGVVQLDIGFFLSFICTLATFSVMLIQLNPDAAAKVG